MASLAGAKDALRSTSAKANFQRLTRLLMCGGLRLLREIFDSIYSPADLPLRLGDPTIKTQLRGARLTLREWNCLYPSPGVYGNSTDFDITLTFRLLRTICNLTPPPGPRGWDDLPNSSDHSLEADLVRIKYYRNAVYGHSTTMEITDTEYNDLWGKISEALIRIAAAISHEKKDEWKKSIDDYHGKPLTPEGERHIEDLKRWYKQEMDLKNEVEELKEEFKTLSRDIKEVARQSQRPTHIEGPVVIVVVNTIGSIQQKELPSDRPQIPHESRESQGICAIDFSDQERAEDVSDSGELQLNPLDTPTEIHIWTVIISFKEAFELFLQYLRNKLHVFVRKYDVGSLLVTVECSSLQILEKLWEDYRSGHLSAIVQEILITAEVLEKLGLIDVEIKTFISDEEYEKGKQILMDHSDSDVTEEERLGERRRRNSDSFLCFKRNEDDVTLLEKNWERQRRQLLEEIKKLRAEIAMAECMQRRLVSQMEESAQGTEDLVRPRNRRRRNSDSSLYCKARDEATAQSEGGAEARHLDSDKYEFVQSYLQNIQETHSTTTETTDSGIRTHFDPSDIEMQDISVMSYPRTARRGNRSRSVIVVEVRIPIPKDKVGLIIGRKGGTVQEIRDRTGVQISITKKHAHLTGTLEQCNNATEIIEEILKGSREEGSSSQGGFRKLDMVIPERFLGHVIGKGREKLSNIEAKTGVALKVVDNNLCIKGSTEQEKKVIQEIKAIVSAREEGSSSQGGFRKLDIEIPERFMGLVIGKGRETLSNIETKTGVALKVIENNLYIKGSTEQGKEVIREIKAIVASARVRPNRKCVFIDERHLPHGCELKLVPVKQRERMILPGAQSQYRLKPVDQYDSQGACALNHIVRDYDASLTRSVLSSLRCFKLETDSACRADMWSHFGKVIIPDPDEADIDETWSITEAINKLQGTLQRRNEWLAAFKEGVELEDKVVYDTFGEQNEEDFIARYDLNFLTPRSQSIRCKVWVAKEGIKKTLEEIPIPFRDLKNVVEELRFEDEATRLRCRGWLVLKSRSFLKANIIFPGSDIDCRLSIRTRLDYAIDDKSGVHEREETNLLSQYLSKLTFTDADGLRRPDETLPQGFLFDHWRCSRRTLYTPRLGFTMIVSKERSWSCDVRDEDSRETTDIHLHCEKWDQALSEEDWEPEEIVAELPEFLQLMYQVQEFVSSHCHRRAER